jgi:hypothetical protein
MDWLKLLILVLPNALDVLRNSDNPAKTYRDALDEAGVELDAEDAKLFADLARDLQEGAT